MKRKELTFLIIALACSIAAFVRFCVELAHATQNFYIMSTFPMNTQDDIDILNSYIPPLVSSAIFCFLSLLAVTVLVLYGVSQRKQIANVFKRTPEHKADKAKQRQAREDLKKQQKIEELQNQLDELKKDE